MMLGRATVTAIVRRSTTLTSPASSFKPSHSWAIRLQSSTPAVEESVAADTSKVPVLQSLAAAVAGVGVVSLAAAIVESVSDVPPYSPTAQRFDQSTFMGRFSRMLLACDPKLLIYTKNDVANAQHILKQRNAEDRKLWEARRIVEGALNGNGDWIPRPFRMSGFVPYNGPICVAMIASPNTAWLLFWSWVNQSQNAAVNYCNRNASSTLDNATLAKSYVAAVGAALSVAFGLATVIQRRYDPVQAKKLLKWVAFPSAVVASSLNCFIVRSPELTTGIPLMDEHGHNVWDGETSQVAAARGVYATTASRALLQAPVYFLPPLLLAAGPLRRYVDKNPTRCVPLTTFLLLVSFGVGLPATVGLFPQISEIPASAVETKFQHLRNAQQQPYEVFYYNKGL